MLNKKTCELVVSKSSWQLPLIPSPKNIFPTFIQSKDVEIGK